ncbi:D-serine ammonia-lyase [Pseudomonas profundi]|uniref:D-serine ammonia-lyase n=1 Tax=Pseudomonas profundi TaxID=1981513 RepID=UPI00123C0CF9|nr:D-serine ammonia-lyase [Pseudomonas profundi]
MTEDSKQAPFSLPPDLLHRLQSMQPLLWVNPGRRTQADPIRPDDVDTAAQRFSKAGPLLVRRIAELEHPEGLIESPLVPADTLRDALDGAGRWLLKADHQLPLAGSVKARGGFHEVLECADRTARQLGWDGQSFAELGSSVWRERFGRYRLVVGSTGNLGISVGLLSRALGFRAEVHMSSDASEWKKQLLRERGVDVVEHDGDYASAVKAGRAIAEADDHSHFVDDERSASLFTGYAVAGRRLAAQLERQNIEVSHEHPLIVYLPCGVGGAPGGIAYGLKLIFGDRVHCWFAEPVSSPSVLMQLASGLESPLSVYDIGLDNRTLADGLAVGQASLLATACMQDRLAGVFTVRDDALREYLALAGKLLGEKLEPSATAGFAGPGWLSDSTAGREWCAAHKVDPANATHVLWSTGGGLVPESVYQRWLAD